MALLKTEGYTISGIAACVPQNSFAISNFAFENETEKNAFITKVGVHYKRIALPGTTASDLCIQAAHELIHKSGIEKNEIDLLVFVTQTPDYLIPFGSSAIQHKLGLNNDCASFDFHTGCSGWVYGLSFVYGFMKTYQLKNALLLCGETSHIVSEKDKSTYPLMGDAGTATLISQANCSDKSFFHLQTFGKESDAITIPDGGSKSPVTVESLLLQNFGDGISRNRLHCSMNGQKILEFSLLSVPRNIKRLLDFACLSTEQIDYLLLHQANKIICEAIRKRLQIDENKTPYSLHTFGNTSSASIPLTLVSQLQNSLLHKPNVVLASGFGVGLSIASAILPFKKMNCVSLSEL